jgi:hypothetical protein
VGWNSCRYSKLEATELEELTSSLDALVCASAGTVGVVVVDGWLLSAMV